MTLGFNLLLSSEHVTGCVVASGIVVADCSFNDSDESMKAQDAHNTDCTNPFARVSGTPVKGSSLLVFKATGSCNYKVYVCAI